MVLATDLYKFLREFRIFLLNYSVQIANSLNYTEPTRKMIDQCGVSGDVILRRFLRAVRILYYLTPRIVRIFEIHRVYTDNFYNMRRSVMAMNLRKFLYRLCISLTIFRVLSEYLKYTEHVWTLFKDIRRYAMNGTAQIFLHGYCASATFTPCLCPNSPNVRSLHAHGLMICGDPQCPRI